MPVKLRIKFCLLIEKMNARKAYSERLGLVDKSKFHGQYVRKAEEKQIC